MRVHIVHFLYSPSFIPTVKDSKWVTATNTVSCQARAGSSIPSGISKTALSNTRWDTRPTCLLFQFNTETPVLLFRLPKSVSQKHKKDHHSESFVRKAFIIFTFYGSNEKHMNASSYMRYTILHRPKSMNCTGIWTTLGSPDLLWL